ncbi:MAG: hypothetical protein ACOVMG_01640 [Flavobacterium sp.]
MKKNIIISLFFLILSTIILSYLHHKIINLDLLQIEEASKTLTKTQINKILVQESNNEYLNFIVVSISTLIKVIIISLVIYIGAFLFNLKISFKKLLSLVIKLEYIFLLPIVYEIIYFKFINTSATLEDIQFFYALSALNIVGYKGLETWFIYPLQVLNLFELAYWLLLSYFIGKLAFTEKDKGKPMDLGFKIVASSYGSALLLWVVVVMFFTLNYS